MLSDIEGATVPEAVELLFNTLRKTETGINKEDFIDLLSGNVISTDELREDIAVETAAAEKRLIMDNFPSEKNNYLVVPKVMDE